MAIFDDLFTELKAAHLSWSELYELLRRAQFDTHARREAIGSLSVDSLDRLVIYLIEQFSVLPLEDRGGVAASILLPREIDVQNIFKAIAENSKAITEKIKPEIHSNGALAKDGNNNLGLTLFSGTNDIVTFDFAPNFSAIYQALLQLQTVMISLKSVAGNSDGNDLLERAQTLAGLLNNANQTLIEIKELANSAKKGATEAAAAAATAQEIAAGAKTPSDYVSSAQLQAEKDAASVSALVEKIKVIGAAADTLEQQVSGYTATFKAFQEQLDARNKVFDEFVAETKSAMVANKKLEAEIDRLIAKADTMIRGATTAGLSSSLDESRKTYGRRMLAAGFFFVISIVVLAASAMPLAAELLPGVFGGFLPDMFKAYVESKDGNQPDPWVLMIGKIFLLFPATWLTLFFAKSYSEFFHLEREYAHKASVAKSLEGFKREAPEFSSALTASVFAEILSNPSDRQSPAPAQHPLHEAITTKFTELFAKK